MCFRKFYTFTGLWEYRKIVGTVLDHVPSVLGWVSWEQTEMENCVQKFGWGILSGDSPEERTEGGRIQGCKGDWGEQHSMNYTLSYWWT